MALVRIVSALIFSLFLSISAHAEGQRVILVLDASGSMWGQINGKSKMDIAKDVVGKVLSTWKPEDDLGLVVYGHREKGSCTDIETILPPGPLDAGKYMSPVKALVPKGKTPMTEAVRQAAEALKYTEQKGTVILVSDGLESCGADPCAVARELAKNGIGLTVHTVGFGLDDKNAVAQLKCMAEETGGISVVADNAEELENALKKTVEAKAEVPAPAPQPVEVKNLGAHVVMAEGVELPPPFDQAVWVFNRAVDGAVGEYVSTEYGKDVKAEFAGEGDFIATVTSDLAKVQVPFTKVAGQPVTISANLNAGSVHFQGMMDESTDLPGDGPVWVFLMADGTYVGTTYGSAPTNLFNAGDYKAKLQMGKAEIEAAFTVVAGKKTDMVVVLGSGVARVSATYSKGGEAVADGTLYEVRKAAGISGEGEYVATEYGSKQVFQLPAGDYTMKAALNIAKAEVPFKVEAGKEVAIDMVLDAGFLAVKAAGATRIDIEAGVPALDGTRARLGTEYAAELNYAANAGPYHIVAYGEGDAKIAEKDVVLEAGKRLEVTLP